MVTTSSEPTSERLDEDVSLLNALRRGARVLVAVPNFDSASHLRIFADERAIYHPYSHALAGLSVGRFPLSSDSAIFLLDGFAGRQEGRGLR